MYMPSTGKSRKQLGSQRIPHGHNLERFSVEGILTVRVSATRSGVLLGRPRDLAMCKGGVDGRAREARIKAGRSRKPAIKKH